MKISTNALVKVAILSAAAFVVMFLETPPVFSTFLKFDFSDIIAVIGGFAMGPLAGVAIQFIKNLLHLLVSQTSGIGELGNFIVGATYVFTAASIYNQNKTRRQAILALILATFIMTGVSVLANYFILLPLYATVLGFTMEAVIGATQVVNPFVTDKLSFLIFAIVPFNLIKAIIVSIVTFFIYKSIAKFINGSASY